MADIFISYARADRDKVEKLANTLEGEGYSVWWDRHIEGGAEFSTDIERELEAAKAVIVCWSKDAAKSRWVKDEAGIAANNGKLIALSLDGQEPPIGFKQFHSIDYTKVNDPAFADLKRTLEIRLRGATASPVATVNKIPDQSTRLLMVAGAVALLVGAIAVYLMFGRDGPMTDDNVALDTGVIEGTAEQTSPGQSTLPDRNVSDVISIAVLPFADLSATEDQQYFSDGIAEEILNVLARVDGLKVASRTSSFRYRGDDNALTDIATALDVQYILEGSVRKAGDTVRITAQLIDGERDAHLWSQTYDNTLTVDNIFDIQDKISTSIVEAIGAGMGLGRTNAVKFAAAAGTDDLRAYDALLEGREMFFYREDHDPNDVVAKLEEVVVLDPEYAWGWSQLAAAYAVQESWRNTNRDYKTLAIDAAEKAISLDPDLAMPHGVIGMATRLPDGRPDKITAIERLNRAIQLDPNDSILLSWRGQHLAELGFFDAAERDLIRALEINPADLISNVWRFKVDLYQGEVDTATDRMSPPMRNNIFLNMHLLIASVAYGDLEARIARFQNSDAGEGFPEDFRAVLIDILIDPTTDPERAYELALRHSGIALDLPIWLYAFKQFERLRNLPDLSGDPVWWLRSHADYLQSPERFRLMYEQGLPDYWHAKGFPPQCRAISPLADGRDFECD